ncbi:MAG: SpoIIIAH-like family protein [Firmicutes bacterium]|nr:SpoIIIAH-like family protein [Bacillota bacterium]
MLSKKSKIFVLVGMLALLVVTGYLNVYLNNRSKSDSLVTANSADFFTTYRNDRTTTRNQTMLYLDSIIESDLSSKEAVAEAEKNKLALTGAMEAELNLEGTIKSMGFDDVVISTGNDYCNVMVKTKELKSEQVAKILEAVTAQTGKTANYVRIIPVE